MLHYHCCRQQHCGDDYLYQGFLDATLFVMVVVLVAVMLVTVFVVVPVLMFAMHVAVFAVLFFFVMVMMCHISSFLCCKVTAPALQPGCKLEGKALSFGKLQVYDTSSRSKDKLRP